MIKVSFEEYQYLLNLDLDDKIALTKIRIKEFVDWTTRNGFVPVVNFSGGVDSTVLLSLCREIQPEILGLFSNTGLEFPEIVSFVRNFDNIMEVRPIKPFHQVIRDHGWPVISKKVSRMIRLVKENKSTTHNSRTLYTTGIDSKGIKSNRWKIPNKWMFALKSPFKISEQCCDYLKKEPFNRIYKKMNAAFIIGTMGEDSEQRREAYLRTGCNSFDASRGPNSTPMAFWKKEEVWEFIKYNKIGYSSVYDMGYKATGCMFCGFGLHLQKYPNRMHLLK